ncbi:MAG: hypothetical protein ACP5I4_14375 [Oceanipulchritudo sp.]
MELRRWILRDPDGSEGLPMTDAEVRSTLADQGSVDGYSIRTRHSPDWIPLHRHGDWNRFISQAQRDACLRNDESPEDPLQESGNPKKPILLAQRRLPPANQPDQREATGREPATFASVEEILDFNARCANQELVRDRYRTATQRGSKRTNRWTELAGAVLLFNTAYFLAGLLLVWLILLLGFLPANAKNMQTAAAFLLYQNPVSSVSFWFGVLLLNFALGWSCIVMRGRL